MNRLLVISGAAVGLAFAAGTATAGEAVTFGTISSGVGYSTADGFSADLDLEFHWLSPTWGASIYGGASIGLVSAPPLEGGFSVHLFRLFGEGSAAGIYAGVSGSNDPSRTIFAGTEVAFSLGMLGITGSVEYDWNNSGPDAIKVAGSLEAEVRDGLEFEFDFDATFFRDGTREFSVGGSAAIAIGDHFTLTPSWVYERYADLSHDFTISLDGELTLGDSPLTLSAGVDYDVTTHTTVGRVGIGFSFDFGAPDGDSPL